MLKIKSVIPNLGSYLKTMSAYYIDTCITMFTATLFTIAKIGNKTVYPTTDELIKKLYIHKMEFY